MIFKVEYVVPQAKESSPFKINRPEGSYRYIFFHFISRVTIIINGKPFDAAPGTCILYEPNKPQLFYVDKNRLNHDYIDFTLIQPDFFSRINFPLNTPISPKSSEFITGKVTEIHNESKSDEIGSVYKVESLMIELFVELSRKIHRRNVYNSQIYVEETKRKFEQIRLNMYQNPDALSVNSLASSLGFSLSRFNELYKAYFSVTPMVDLTNARVSRVKELISQHVKTRDIIKTLGFSSQEYFYRWFKKYFKCTKEKYIKEHVQNETY